MADVLRAVEDAEGQPGEEVPGREVARHWTQLEARALWNKGFKCSLFVREISLPRVASKSSNQTYS